MLRLTPNLLGCVNPCLSDALQQNLLGVRGFNRWDYSDGRYCDAMKWLYTLQQEGKIKELGLTNFDTEHMAKIVEDCGIPIVSNQVSDFDTTAF